MPAFAAPLLIEGNGKLDRVTVKGDEAEIATIVGGLAEPGATGG
jgi:hypothetical protein